jgi:Raf kinase inhibitor-like YbhB/YbcL family protein
MSFQHTASVALGKALRSVHAGEAKLASQRVARGKPATLEVSSPAFVHGGRLPYWATTDGVGVAPRIEWSPVPPQTRSIAILCEDPDAPFPRPFVHWMVWDIPPTARVLDPAVRRTPREGKNSMLRHGFAPAAPPPGHGTHRYHFQVFALDTLVPLEAGSGRSALVDAMRGHVLAWGEIVGTWERE